MKRSQATKTIVMVFVGLTLVSCSASSNSETSRAVVAPAPLQNAEFVLSAPAQRDTHSTNSSWKKTKNGLEVAADAKAARKNPASAKVKNLDEAVLAGPQAQMRITQITNTTAEAQGLGQIAGPATLVEMQVTNKSEEALDLSVAQLRLYFGKQQEPAALLTDQRSVALPTEVKAGASVTATYLFSAKNQKNKNVWLEFETGTTEEIQQLKGQVAR